MKKYTWREEADGIISMGASMVSVDFLQNALGALDSAIYWLENVAEHTTECITNKLMLQSFVSRKTKEKALFKCICGLDDLKKKLGVTREGNKD